MPYVKPEYNTTRKNLGNVNSILTGWTIDERMARLAFSLSPLSGAWELSRYDRFPLKKLDPVSLFEKGKREHSNNSDRDDHDPDSPTPPELCVNI